MAYQDKNKKSYDCLKENIVSFKTSNKEFDTSNMANIVFICDETYIIPTVTAITSLIKNKKQNTCYTVYIVANNISDSSINIFYKFNNIKNINIKIIKKSIEYAEFKINNGISKVTTSAILKFKLADILSNLDKVLYLDGDVIVQKDLLELYNTELTQEFAAAVKDLRAMYKFNPSVTERLKITRQEYFNSGVMLLNLSKIREDNISEKLLEYRKNGINFFMDQDALNVVFENNVKYLSLFNNFMLTVFSFFSLDEINYYFDISENKKNKKYFVKESAILHFTSNEKPWQYYNTEFNKIWYSYYKQSPLSEKLHRIKYEGIHNLNFLQRCFSVTNGKNKTHKIITIAGIKIKIKVK